ncbi:MAG TPA: hypothetical protein VGM81_13290 [Burkholderiaceae bacterium]
MTTRTNLKNLTNVLNPSGQTPAAPAVKKAQSPAAVADQVRRESASRLEKGDFRVDDGFGGENGVASLIKGLHLARLAGSPAALKKVEDMTLLERVSDPNFAVTQGLRPNERSDVATCIKAVQLGGGTPLQAHLGLRKN